VVGRGGGGGTLELLPALLKLSGRVLDAFTNDGLVFKVLTFVMVGVVSDDCCVVDGYRKPMS